MLIDDNEIDNFINEKLIKAYYFAENVYVHTSAKSALEFLKNVDVTLDEVPENLIPAYIFLDINMPILDGFNFLDEFASFSKPLKEKIKIAMLSTSLNPKDVEKSKTYSNVVKFMHKPLSEHELTDL